MPGKDGEVAQRIRFDNAWPCRWRLTTLDALRSEVRIEEAERLKALMQKEPFYALQGSPIIELVIENLEIR